MTEIDGKLELFETLCALSDAEPAMRIGQLIATIGEVCSDLCGRGLWDAENQQLLEAAWKFQRDIDTNMPAEVYPRT